MEYREQVHVKIGLPAEVKGLGRQTVPLQVSIESKRPLKHVAWQQDVLVAAGGSVIDLGSGNYAVKLPDYHPGVANSYVISAVAHDVEGRRSQPATAKVTVTGPDIDVAKSSLAADRTVIQANGQEKSVLKVELRDGAGEPVTGMAAGFEAALETAEAQTTTADGQPAALSGFAETEPGIYTATLTAATHPGVAHIAVSVVGTALGEIDVRMVYDSSSANIGQGDLTVDKHTIVANGADAATYTAVVKNAFGDPARDIQVSWSTDQGLLSDASSTTDAAGMATTRLTSTVLGTAQVTAQVGSQAVVHASTVAMASDHNTAMIGQGDLTVDKVALSAGTTDTATYTASVKNAKGNLVANATVNWHRNLGQLSASSSTTDAAGIATVALASTTTGIAQVTAQVGNQSAVNAPSVTIHADSGSSGIGAGGLTVDKNTVIADSRDAAIYSALVRDAFGNPVPLMQVSWATDRGVFSGTSSATTSSTTDAAGVAMINLTSTVSGTAQVTAQVGSQAAVNAPSVTFVFDPATVKLTLGTTKIKITGTGADDAIVTATLTDANSNPVARQTVAWTTTFGSLPSSTVTDANGLATVTFNAIARVASNVTANVTATSASASQTQAITVRAVQQTGGRDYWTMYSDLNTAVEATANGHCAANGGGMVATRADLSAFASAGGDFARMGVPGEYGNIWYSLGGAWGVTSGDFHSGASPPGATSSGLGSAYVCVK